jgi:hypothetical protein
MQSRNNQYTFNYADLRVHKKYHAFSTARFTRNAVIHKAGTIIPETAKKFVGPKLV